MASWTRAREERTNERGGAKNPRVPQGLAGFETWENHAYRETEATCDVVIRRKEGCLRGCGNLVMEFGQYGRRR